MPTDPATVRPRRSVLVAGTAALVITAAAWWWVRGADERRVDAACETWLGHRGDLRGAVSESEEAVGRARDDRAATTAAYFNDLERTSAALQEWLRESPDVVELLDHSSDASSLDRAAVQAFEATQSGVAELQRLVDEGTPDQVAGWLPELSARFQMVDDVCLAAARDS